MVGIAVTGKAWPPLPLHEWRDTCATLHRWTQVAGKVCLALTPRVNHWWNAAFHLSSRGLATAALDAGGRTLTMEFDFIAHQLALRCSDGRMEAVALAPKTVAAFYREVMQALERLGVDVRIWPMSVEIPDPARLDEDEIHRSYDPDFAHDHWRALCAMHPIFLDFRSRFIGKCSPVHFFWGSFDLAVTRFSGRPAPERPGADSITREAYSHEVISHGFWAGGGSVDEPAFYAYAAPEPEGFSRAAVEPSAAFYSREFSNFILPYEVVRTAPAPAATLTAFLETTYDQAATLAKWNRRDLERK